MSRFAMPARALRAVAALALATVLIALLSVHATAQADPYPPSVGTSSSASVDPAATSAHRPASSTDPTTTDDSSHGLAQTGFATVTATLIAISLLGGGLLLVALGRRGGSKHKG
jgi:hypothetical protein